MTRIIGGGRGILLILVVVGLLLGIAVFMTATPSSQGNSSQPSSSSLPSVSSRRLSESYLSEIHKFSADSSPRVLNVHVVPHTHDDVGWRKTVEQYYYGLNDTIDTKGHVNSILSTAVAALVDNPARTFVYSETKFFAMWWKEQSSAMHDTVRSLLANQQWIFVNGGWCMHDEATTHYMGMIDQMTLGHDFLVHTVGLGGTEILPTIAWQLDPFGHSFTQAKLMTARNGMNALYFGRIDYQDLELRKLTQECEGLWYPTTAQQQDANMSYDRNTTTTVRSSDSDSSLTDSDLDTIFWGLTGSFNGNYGPPEGFMIDLFTDDEPLTGMMDKQDELLERLDVFLRMVRVQSNQVKDNHIMLTFGQDFTFKDSHYNFANLDVLIGSIMNFQRWNMIDIAKIFGGAYDRLNIFYSNPEYYTKMKYQSAQPNKDHMKESRWAKKDQSLDAERWDIETVRKRRLTALSTNVSHLSKDIQLLQERAKGSNVQWTVKTDDFFPYSDCPHCFWTGYFTSRTAFKRFERVASSFLMAARQIISYSAFLGLPTALSDTESSDQSLLALEDALGVSQHHDAVSGTAKQHVADDYSKRLKAGLDIAANVVVGKIKSIMLERPGKDLQDLTYCQLLNETICSVSETATLSNRSTIYVLVYNSLSSNRSSIVRLPVSTDDSYKVERVEDNQNVGLQLIRPTTRSAVHTKGEKERVLLFGTGEIPPLGIATFRIARIGNSSMTVSRPSMRRSALGDDPVVVTTDKLSVMFDGSTGMITKISSGGADLDIAQSWGYYTSFDSKYDHSYVPSHRTQQNSGAYIFSPSTPEQEILPLNPVPGQAVFVNTSVGMEVHVSFDRPWVKQITRVFNGQHFVEIEYTVGPVPVNDGRGKEIVTRYLSPIKSDGVFSTDSNGREFLKRRRNYRPTWSLNSNEPIAGNYYPVNAAIYVEDKNAAMSVVVDRSQGGTSLRDGSVELMVQRRTLADDARGVDEPLNETTGGMTAYPPYGNATRIGDGVIIRGVHRLMVGKGPSGASLARSAMDGAFAEPIVFVGSSPSGQPVSFKQPSFSSLQSALPPNVLLITFSLLRKSDVGISYLIRLAHQYGMAEDRTLSAPVTVDLRSLLSGKTVLNATEKTLAGQEDWGDFIKRKIVWTGAHLTVDSTKDDPPDLMVTLNPMDIKTFVVDVASDTPLSHPRGLDDAVEVDSLVE